MATDDAKLRRDVKEIMEILDDGEEQECLKIIKKHSLEYKHKLLVQINEEADMSLLAYSVSELQKASTLALLGEPEAYKKLVTKSVHDAVEDALEEAIRLGDLPLVDDLITDYYIRDQDDINNLTRAEETESELMIAACSKTKTNRLAMVEFLYDNGFRIRDHLEKYQNDGRYTKRATEYHYKRYKQLRALTCPVYLVCRAEEQHKNVENMDEHQVVRGNYGQARKDEASIYDDNTIFGLTLPLFDKMRKAQAESELFVIEYDKLQKDLEQFLVNLIHESKVDIEHRDLMKITHNDDDYSDREFIPLLKQCCDLELKELSGCKPFQGGIDHIVNRYFVKDFPNWPSGDHTQYIGYILMILIGLSYPILCMAFLLSPHSWLGRFSHYPAVSFACEAMSEVYWMVMILIYPYVVTSSSSHMGYNIALLVVMLCKIQKECMEMVRRTWVYYCTDLYNIIDWLEICAVLICVICRFVKDPFVNPADYTYVTTLADGFFACIPIAIMMRLLLLFRVNRKIGILQISFARMGDDVFAWAVIVFTILIGYSVSFHAFSSQVLVTALKTNNTKCANTQWNAMVNPPETFKTTVGFYTILGQLYWNMLMGTADEGIKECFGFHWVSYVAAYLLVATFSLMVIIVLLNLLIAMMSKTHTAVCDDGVRETEWMFHMTNLWVKFIRRDFVAPVPMNVLPHFHKHICGENAFWRGKSPELEPVVSINLPDMTKVNSVNSTIAEDAVLDETTASRVEVTHEQPPAAGIRANTMLNGSTTSQERRQKTLGQKLTMELGEAEVIARNQRYTDIVYCLVKRYRRKNMTHTSDMTRDEPELT